jgi:hypothetical protein
LKAIANGIAVRCRKRKEESMIRQLKFLHEKRQEESRKALLAKKQSSWAKIASTQEMVAISRNIRLALDIGRFIAITHIYFSEKWQLNQTWKENLERNMLLPSHI